MKKRKKGHALKKRYGRFSIAAEVDAIDRAALPKEVRRTVNKHPVVAAAMIGGTISAIGAGSTPLTAALIGAMSAVTSREILKWAAKEAEDLL